MDAFGKVGELIMNVLLTLSPIFCWIALSAIRKEQKKQDKIVNDSLFTISQHLKALNNSMRTLNENIVALCGGQVSEG